MGRPQKLVQTADLTYMSEYQLKKWRRLLFLSIALTYFNKGVDPIYSPSLEVFEVRDVKGRPQK